ncbi:MAG: hypothetical protein H6819_00480 [Phycisphaerales bacterium]|nr:hypothetical protein [Phycisphaerales bacterium]MCB9857315.1 hypothetical protein [Phycisphaerales bacterium]MCB9862971.1 hypothetical protein [Phycisphaerales bacterium]
MRKALAMAGALAAIVLAVQEAKAQTGACCSNLTGLCTIETQSDCESVVNGVYLGDGIACESVQCNTPVGACCFADTGFCSVVTEATCMAESGNYQGNATSCDPNMCPQPTGACCDGLFGGCMEVTQAQCSPGNLGDWRGPGTTCEAEGCPDAGACCDPDDGSCLVLGEPLCTLRGNDFLGEGTTCDPNVCPQPPTGACCQESGECQSDYTEYACVNQTSGGVWAGPDTTCDPVNPCPQPAFGACCFAGGGCIVTAEYLCADAFGEFQGEDSTCYPSPCNPNQITGWCDNFDSYTDGQQLYHVGGWTGWDDFSPAAGFVSTAQARSAPNSIDVGGFKDAVHPFTTAFAGGTWEIVAWQYIPSELTGTTFFVVNSYYEHGGPYFFPVELHFDPSGDYVYDALRDSGATTTLPLIYDQWVEIRIEADFDNDWPGNISSAGTIREYYNGQLLMEESWIPVTGGISVGQLAIMNIDLYAPHGESVYYDDLCVTPLTQSQLDPRRPLFVGTSETSLGLPTRTSDLTGAPSVTWTNGYNTDVAIEGAAGRPDGAIYIAGTQDGTFRPNLFIAPFEGPTIPLCEFGTSFTAGPSGLAYGRGKLYGYFNFASPLGIYEIDPATCDKTLLVDTSPYRFFGLDYNPADGLLYGYTGFGSPTGLYSIDPDTGVMTFVAPSVPAANASANALAVGNNTVYVAGTRGAEGVPMFSYDLSQGANGSYVAITQAFPESNAQAGAAYATGPVPGDMNCDGKIDGKDIQAFVTAVLAPAQYESTYVDCTILNADVNLDASIDTVDVAPFVLMLSGN